MEVELNLMKETGAAFHFLLLREISKLSKEEMYPLYFQGNAAGSLISYLLDISSVNSINTPIELVWGVKENANIPDFSIFIAEPLRPMIHSQLDNKYRNVSADETSYFRIGLVELEICLEIGEKKNQSVKYRRNV